MNEKKNRKDLIVDLISSQKIHTQDELLQALCARGVNVTQATLSRDIKKIGAFKISDASDGQYYTLPSKSALKSHFTITKISVSGQLCVLHCEPEFAVSVAMVIDEAAIDGVMGTVAGQNTVFLALRADSDSETVTSAVKSLFNIGEITVRVALESDFKYAETICDEIFISSQERKTGIARRTPNYIREKMAAGKAVIALSASGEFAGFSYIESWGGKSFVATSGLIVAHKFRGMGIARRIKEQTFLLSRRLFPNAKIFSITTGAAVMKMNYEFGFRPVPYTELTDDPEFWKGCSGCRHFDILRSHDYKMCICTGLLYDPEEHLEIHQPTAKK